MKWKLFLILFLSLISSNGLASLSEGLVGYFPFSGNANDASGNENHGVVHGAILTADRFGQPDSAYSFDGSTNYIQVPESASLQIQDAITLSAWVFHLSNSSPQHIVNMSELYTGYRLAAWWANPAGNSLELYDENNAQQIIDDGRQPYIGVWTHVAGTWDGTAMRMYRNGVLDNQVPFDGQISIAYHDLYIGVINPIPFPIQGYFHGYLDEVRIYNRALSQDEINQLMAIHVDIDIIPNSDANNVNVNRRGFLPVAILSNIDFDALDVDDETVTFGPGSATAQRIKEKDVDHDGDMDLVLYFDPSETGISCGDVSAALFGETNDGILITGEESVTVKGCK